MENTSESAPSAQSIWHVESVSSPGIDELIDKWYLDTPKQGDEVVDSAAINVKGWALCSEDQQNRLHIVLRFRDRTQSHALNVDRVDVVKAVLDGEEPSAHPQLRCGFNYSVAMEDAVEGFEIGFEIDGYIYSVAKVFAR